jgi:hypothetical protein
MNALKFKGNQMLQGKGLMGKGRYIAMQNKPNILPANQKICLLQTISAHLKKGTKSLQV